MTQFDFTPVIVDKFTDPEGLIPNVVLKYRPLCSYSSRDDAVANGIRAAGRRTLLIAKTEDGQLRTVSWPDQDDENPSCSDRALLDKVAQVMGVEVFREKDPQALAKARHAISVILGPNAPWERDRAEIQVASVQRGLRELVDVCHTLARNSGWWDEYDAMPEQYRKYFICTKLFLGVSEIVEGLEGFRKGLMDDHLPDRKMLEVELADALIRIGDLAGALGLDIAGATIEKLAYNQQRPDHKPENRAAPGGKQV